MAHFQNWKPTQNSNFHHSLALGESPAWLQARTVIPRRTPFALSMSHCPLRVKASWLERLLPRRWTGIKAVKAGHWDWNIDINLLSKTKIFKCYTTQKATTCTFWWSRFSDLRDASNVWVHIPTLLLPPLRTYHVPFRLIFKKHVVHYFLCSSSFLAPGIFYLYVMHL